MQSNNRIRLHRLDTLRGLCLISMAAYHGLWNLVYLFGMKLDWYRGTPGYLWQQSICWTFIILSGFSWNLGSRPLKRGAMVFGGGVLVSLVTHLLMPASRITFGILTCLGSCMLLMIPLDKLLKKVSAGVGAAVSILLFVLLRDCNDGTVAFGLVDLPGVLYRNLLTTYLGFPMAGFYSADYFPLLPWLCLFTFGYFLHRLVKGDYLVGRPVPVLDWMGRNSLLVYLLHQPVLYGICLAAQYLMK